MIILTCGHEVESYDAANDIITQGYTRENTKCINYMVVCNECLKEYKESGELFESDEAATEWLDI
jgi:hypothetical protein